MGYTLGMGNPVSKTTRQEDGVVTSRCDTISEKQDTGKKEGEKKGKNPYTSGSNRTLVE